LGGVRKSEPKGKGSGWSGKPKRENKNAPKT